MNQQDRPTLREIVPKSGLVFSERGALSEVLCKPKLLPLKSVVLTQLETINAAVEAQADDTEAKEREASGGIYKDH